MHGIIILAGKQQYMNILKTFIPPKPQGQKDVKALSLPPIDIVKIAFVGMGKRGLQALERWCHIAKVEIVAICDTQEKSLQDANRILEKLSRPTAKAYHGAEAYQQLCRECDAHLIYICTDWNMHTPIALAALHESKNVAVEVPAAMTLEEIWQIVDMAERKQRHCMMLENAVYDNIELATYHLAQQGLLGEIVHTSGGYAHPLGNRWTPWRIRYNKENQGDLYPTHGIGPLCRILDIHRTDQLQYLVAMDTAAFSGASIYEKLIGEKCNDFKNGDQTTVMIKTQKGKTITLQHNVMTPQPYSRMFEIVGTKGYVSKYPIPQMVINKTPYTDTINTQTQEHTSLTTQEIEPIIDKALPQYVHQLKDKAMKLDNRGGMSFYMDYRLATALQQGLPLDMDVYDLAEWCSISHLSRISIENNSMPVEIPNFIR